MAGNYKRIKGLPELLAVLGDLGASGTIARIAYRGTIGAAKDLKELARANAQPHYKSGALDRGFAVMRIERGTRKGYTVGVRAGTKHKRNTRKGDLPQGADAPAEDDAYYWWYLEFGSVHHKASGFFQRAFAEMQTKAPEMIIAAGMKAVVSSANAAARKHFKGGKIN